MPKTKLYALLHDGNFEGDSSFYFPGTDVPYKEGDTMKDLTEKYKAKLASEVDDMKLDEAIKLIGQEWEEDDVKPTGAVIIDGKFLDLLSEVWDASDPGNDSGTYRTNRICKVLAWNQRVKYLGKKMV